MPDQPMQSVAMDVFSMPEVHIGKETSDCVVLCVDRHSGYVVAVPARKKGLLAKEVAVMMIRHWLTVFDIPRTICSDRGPQFTGGWFKAMCSLMGIRHAKSVAYLSRSNGRAESAGRQLFEKLRKIHITNPRRNWFEEMWPALKAHHDTPTPGGLSPHQILFGRDPLGRGLPLPGDGITMDAKEFFARQEARARDIRQQLEKEHAERQKSAPSSTAQKFRVGDPVWVIRPRPMGTHRTKTWFTPGEVVRRIGEDTYCIKVGHGQFRERHESQLRVQEPDLRGQNVSLDYAAHEADSDDDYAEQNNYTVEKILAKRPERLGDRRPGVQGSLARLWAVPRHLGTRLLVRAADQYFLHGLHPQAQDQDPFLRLGSTHPGNCSQGRLISALSSPLMQFERLCGRRIVPHLLALFHLSVTCHQSCHIPPPAASRGGWPLSSYSSLLVC